MIDYFPKNKFKDMGNIIGYKIKSNSYTIMILHQIK